VRGEDKKRGVRNFVEGKYSAGTDQPRQGTQDGDRIGKKLQNKAAHHGVEGFAARDLRNIGLGKADVAQAGLGNSSQGPSDGARIALHSHHFPRRTDQLGCQHGHVPDAGTDIQDTLTWANAGVTEESFGERSETRSLANEALVLGVGAAEGVMRSGTGCGHAGPGL